MPKEHFGGHRWRRNRKRRARRQAASRTMSEDDQQYDPFNRECHGDFNMGSKPEHTFIDDSSIKTSQGFNQPTFSPFPNTPEAFGSSSMARSIPGAYEQGYEGQFKDDNSRHVINLEEDDTDLCIPETPKVVEEKFLADREGRTAPVSLLATSESNNELTSEASQVQHHKIFPTAVDSSGAARNFPSHSTWRGIQPVVNVITSFMSSNPRHSASMTSSQQETNGVINDKGLLLEKMQENEKALEKSKRKYDKLADDNEKLRQTAQQFGKWEAELEKENQRLRREKNQQEIEFRDEIREVKAERDLAEEKYEELIRNQQEQSFRQMSSGRWVPIEDNKIVAEFARIKRDIRNWARNMAINDMKTLGKLNDLETLLLLQNLSNVAVIKHKELPGGLDTSKSPGLLLNALLAHHICTPTFRDPFFCLGGESGKNVPESQKAGQLRTIYAMAQTSNEEDAHAWRSQTLRMLLPALGNNATEREKQLHAATQRSIVDFAETRASAFMQGTARFLLNPSKVNEEEKKKLVAIYQEAASLSYRLWTQKTSLRCLTLKDISAKGTPGFNAESGYFKPHSMVRYEDHDDQLKGKPITLIVHPLILAMGNEEGKNYDTHRLWANAEVWLDSKLK